MHGEGNREREPRAVPFFLFYQVPVYESSQAVLREILKAPPKVHSVPEYSVTRLRRKGAAVMDALPRTASVEVLLFMAMLVVHSVELEKP